jgi:plastocyanin
LGPESLELLKFDAELVRLCAQGQVPGRFLEEFPMKRYAINLALVAIFAMGFSSAALAMYPLMHNESQKISQRAKTGKAVKTATVIIDGFQFMPDNLVLKKGGKVTFINKDSTPHTVTPDEGSKFMGTGRLEKDAPVKTITFTTTGEQHYFCEIHPSMKGKITVVP